ncbi:G-type lectin S-receptor-like serine/threonine-protein kinase [Tripterygium wilfordii]|uniref:G-type lectin S-receptor-like serine/threonine-protein kinase n=1 Tax=Tripterygium wilfordii TaxID=458696 RepID=A0A7J7D236_TRIWF|nr:G-type lectin S-receptor-like serine/threonine-protein kinase [Tripterygium wilfordii]
METILFFSTCFLLYALASGSSFKELIYPNFTASNLQFVEGSGSFFYSHNGTFKAAIFNPGTQQSNFYLCVIHVASNTIIWSANRDSPISNSGQMMLTTEGIAIADRYGIPKWSTPPLRSAVYALLLAETGNLVLLDHFNSSLWESFHNPTDTIVMGQYLPVGAFLSSSVSNDDLSMGDYRFIITGSDAILQWNGQTYWKLSMETKAYTNSNYVAEYMTVNRTGLFLFSRNGSVVVIQVNLSPSDFRIAQLGASGQFIVRSFSNGDWETEFLGPVDSCQIPFICGSIGLCNGDSTSNTPTCSCPLDFHGGSQNTSGCVPNDSSFSLPHACDSADKDTQSNLSDFSYLTLGEGIGYFATEFNTPVKFGVNLSVCQDFCTGDCLCLGVFYENSSGSCYALEKELGSVIWSNSIEDDMLAYIKALVQTSPTPSNGNNNVDDQGQNFPLAALVLLPFTGCFLVVAFGFLWWRRQRLFKSHELKLRQRNSLSSRDLENFFIPGLPKKFNHSLDHNNSAGGQSILSSGSGLVYFPLFALEMHEQGRYLELADPRLEGRVTSEDVEKLVRIALCCAHEEPALRPSMASVVGMLEGGISLGKPRLESLNFLRFIGRRFTEASTIEEEKQQSVIILYPQADTSPISITSGSRACLSYISSQQVSGPR